MTILHPTEVPDQTHIRPEAASLDNPLYYLENALTVAGWVRTCHGDLLTDPEMVRLNQLHALPRPSQALLIRLVMRSRNLFRVQSLDYPELGQPVAAALIPLVSDGWVDPAPPLTSQEVCDLLRKDELTVAFGHQLKSAGLKSSASKSLIQAALHEFFADGTRTLEDWWPTTIDRVIRLNDMALFDRLRLMFFGNLRQTWSEFVITELGHQRYEPVPLSPASRAFNAREDVDQYLALHACRERLDQATTTEDCQILWQQLPPETDSNPWLQHRRARLLFALGQKLERAGDLDLARESYYQAWIPDARVRYFRLLEKTAPLADVWPLIQQAEALAETPDEKQSLGRILQRVGKKIGMVTCPSTPTQSVPVQTIVLQPIPEIPVEQQVAMALTKQGGSCFYVENTLFTALFGLLFWPTIFAPQPGAFFHPFQSGPADLYREDFAGRRCDLIDETLQSLQQGDYRDRIWYHWHTRHGTTNPFIYWPAISEELLTLALELIPAMHLTAIFTRMLADIRAYRSGLPDLIRFLPEDGTYELIEVKAPGDRLQDHQRRWMAFFAENGIAASVCHVTWDATL